MQHNHASKPRKRCTFEAIWLWPSKIHVVAADRLGEAEETVMNL